MKKIKTHREQESDNALPRSIIPVETRSVNRLWPFEPTASVGTGPVERRDRAVGNSRDWANQCSARVGARPTGTSGLSTLTRVVVFLRSTKAEKNAENWM